MNVIKMIEIELIAGLRYFAVLNKLTQPTLCVEINPAYRVAVI